MSSRVLLHPGCAVDAPCGLHLALILLFVALLVLLVHNDPIIITACCCCGDCRCPINNVQRIEDFSEVAWLYMIFGQVSFESWYQCSDDL